MTLLAAYNFDEASGAVVDVTGNAHGFTPVGNTARTASGAGHTDKGLNQTTSSTDAGPAVFGLTANRTMMMWIKSTASVTDGRIFETVAVSDANSIWEFLFRDTAWHLQAWNATTFARATTTRPTDSAWHHLAGTYDGTNLRLYLDATLVATTALTAPLRTDGTSVNVFHTCPTTIIDDARFYDVTLTQAQISTLMGTPVTGGITQAVGTVTETDAGQPIGRRKTRATGIATEPDTAQPIGRRKTRVAGITAEADAAQPLARRKVRAVGTAVETDAPSPVTRIKIRALGLVVETDVAQPTGRRKIRAAGVATETNGALPLGRSKIRPVLFASEADAAQLITKPSPFVGIANETDQALPIGRRKVRALGIAVDLSSAVAIGRVHYRLIGAAVEVEEARHSAVVKRRAISAAQETDLAVALVPSEAPTESVLTTGNALSSGLTVAHPQPDLTPSNAPSSHLEVSHGV